MCMIAASCGYEYVVKVQMAEQLKAELSKNTKIKGLCFIEVDSAIGARTNLGRPTTKSKENKNLFVNNYGGRG